MSDISLRTSTSPFCGGAVGKNFSYFAFTTPNLICRVRILAVQELRDSGALHVVRLVFLHFLPCFNIDVDAKGLSVNGR